MKWLTLEKIKQQCRIEQDFTLEDDLLTGYGTSAENTILNHLNRTYYDLLEQYGAVPQDIINASMMLVDVWYQHRSPVEALSLSIVPYTFDILIKPYMKLVGSIGGGDDYQTVTLGSDVKIEFTADLPDGLLLKDVDFTVKVINMSEKDVDADFVKADCIMTDEGESYVVLVDSEELGIGTLMLRLTVFIPDTDYQSGTRKEVIKINPHIRITG
jgi:uncharacterized phage protein (predicted DNA packaging)